MNNTNANKLIDEADRDEIARQIGEAEKGTSAELVCAVASESGRYDRAEAIVGIVTSLIALAALHWMQPWFLAVGSWDTGGIGLAIQIVTVCIAFVAGNYLASYCFPLRRIFVAQRELTREVERAAAYVFCRHSMGETKARTGLLIYVSLFERKVVILADQSCQNALGDSFVKQVRDAAVENLKTKSVKQALMVTIDQLSAQLDESLPANRELDANELANHVLILGRV